MLEERLEQIRTKISTSNKGKQQIFPTRCATPLQSAGFEKSLGMTLPDEYREFIMQIEDGGLLTCSLFRENSDNPYWWPRPLVVFPLKQTPENGSYLCGLVRWDDLTGHEKMESNMALQFALDSGFYFRTLVLSGPQRGRVWSSANRLDLGRFAVDQFDGLSFFDWVEKILDQQC